MTKLNFVAPVSIVAFVCVFCFLSNRPVTILLCVLQFFCKRRYLVFILANSALVRPAVSWRRCERGIKASLNLSLDDFRSLVGRQIVTFDDYRASPPGCIFISVLELDPSLLTLLTSSVQSN